MAEFGLVGYPITHSKSPQMQQAGFRAAGRINDTYALFSYAPADFATCIPALLHEQQVAGLNVTTPYKETIQPYLDGLTDLAHQAGSVNTVYRDMAGKIIGDSTDGPGFWQVVAGLPNVQRILLLGVGATARSIMASQPAGYELIVANRQSPRFDKYAEQVAALTGGRLLALSTVTEILDTVDLIVDATTVGMQDDASILSADQMKQVPVTTMIMDLKYGKVTTLQQLAATSGHPVMDGQAMLIEQGRLSQARWTGILPAFAVMQAGFQAKE